MHPPHGGRELADFLLALPHRTDAMFTTIEGEWDECMDVVKRATEAVSSVAPRTVVVTDTCCAAVELSVHPATWVALARVVVVDPIVLYKPMDSPPDVLSDTDTHSPDARPADDEPTTDRRTPRPRWRVWRTP